MPNKEPSGLLSKTDRPFTLQRFDVNECLEKFVDYFWVVQWSIPTGEIFTSENLPYPCVHLVYEPGNTALYGPVKGCFKKNLSGQGKVIGCRFKTGYFYPWLKRPVAEITDQHFDANLILPVSSNALEQRMEEHNDTAQAVKCFSVILMDALPQQIGSDEAAGLAHRIVSKIESDQELSTVKQVCSRYAITTRQLERLFHKYVGLTPKWVLRMYRLQQLADEIVSGKAIDWTDLAQRLGYFDQSHCIRDFKKVTGRTPSAYC